MKRPAVVFPAAPTSRAAPATGLAGASVLLAWMKDRGIDLTTIGLFALVRFLKQRSKEVVDTPLSDEEKQRAEALLKDVRS